MSTTIYNGYKLPSMTAYQLAKFNKSLREEITESSIDTFHKNLALRAANSIDELTLSKNDKTLAGLLNSDVLELKVSDINSYKNRSLLTHSYISFKNERKLSLEHNLSGSVTDLDCEVVYIPLENKTLALFFSHNEDHLEIWENQDGVEFYGYWNNTDKDEECSDAEWEQRRIDWDEALPGLGIPSEAGFSFSLFKGIPDIHSISIERITEHIPTLEDRAHEIAKRILSTKKYTELEKEYQPMNAAYQLSKWLKTNEVINKLELMKDDFSSQLIPDLKENYLNKKLLDFNPFHL